MAQKYAPTFQGCSLEEQDEVIKRHELCLKLAAHRGPLRPLILKAAGADGWCVGSIYRWYGRWKIGGRDTESLVRYKGDFSREIGHPINWGIWTPREVRLVMELAGCSQKEVADHLHVDQARIGNLLSGRSQGPKAQEHAAALTKWATETLTRLATEKRRKR